MVKRELLRWLLRLARPMNALAVPVACLFVLLWPRPLDMRLLAPWIFIALHAWPVVWRLANARRGPAAFLYGRGFSREALWGHTLLAGVVACLAVWLPAALLVWTGARCSVQDAIFHSPFYPVFSVNDRLVPLAWLSGYAASLAALLLFRPAQFEPAGRRTTVAQNLRSLGTKALSRVVVAVAILLIAQFAVMHLIGPLWMLMRGTANASPKQEGDRLSIGLQGTNLTGADVWINDVYLGRTPIEMSLDEFLEKMPQWSSPPDNERYDRKGVQLPHYSPRGSGTRGFRTWSDVRVPLDKDLRNPTVYYARVSHAGEVAYCRPGGFSCKGGSRGRFISVRIEVVFPERQRRIEMLLDQARALNYSVGPDWFEAMETYEGDGWRVLADAAYVESSLIQVADAWASWRYGLASVSDTKGAWDVFDHILKEADTQGIYVTDGVAGRAVELLVPKLDTQQVIGAALPLIDGPLEYGHVRWTDHGEVRFGIVYRPQGYSISEGQVGGGFRSDFDYSSASANMAAAYYGSGGRRLPPRAAALAHALWRLDARLDQRSGTDNPVEMELAPALLRSAYGPNGRWRGLYLEMASQIGGEAVATFLIRQDWNELVEPWDPRNAFIRGGDFNAWLYLLANLRDPAGDAFRHRHAQDVFDLADELLSSPSPAADRLAPFLFWNLDLGKGSLAYRYWPRFCDRVTRRRGLQSIDAMWRYLARLEPLPTVEMYVDAVQAARDPSPFLGDILKQIAALPLSKRQAILDACMPVFEAKWPNSGLYIDPPPNDPVQAEEILRALRAGRDYKLEEVSLWLQHEQPDHPLVAMLVAASEPQFRAAAIGALESHPTPEHRTMLQALTDDPDDSVRQSARDAAARIQQLVDTPPLQLASKPVPVAKDVS